MRAEKPLSEDLLPNVESIAIHIYGAANASTERRVRHLIAKGELPVKKVAGRLESRRSWIDALYSEPDPVAVARGGRR